MNKNDDSDVVVNREESNINDNGDEDEGVGEEVLLPSTSNKEVLSTFLQNKPKEFIDFLNENNIPQDSYDINLDDLPRFIRLNNRLINNDNKEQSIKQIELELGTKLEELKWLPNFYKLKSTIGISSCSSYKKGIMYGMDASSGAAILALDPQPGDNVLDICTAPGTKLCMIADLMNGQGTVTGVDISPSRLGACKTIIKKYKIPKARLFQCDASQFTIKAPSQLDPLPHLNDQSSLERSKKKQKVVEEKGNNNNDNNNRDQGTSSKDDDNDHHSDDSNNIESKDKQLEQESTTPSSSTSILTTMEKKRKSKKHGKRIKYDLKDLYFSTDYFMRYSNSLYYDRVIVDAECSLDASIRHLIQYSKLGRNFIPSELTELTNLQKRLIQTGFNLLKEGGVMVYSTCSFCKAENEDVVAWLLTNNPNSSLEPCFGDDGNDNNNNSGNNGDQSNNNNIVPFSRGYIKNTYRFYPKNGTSGMFIARIAKKSSETI